MSSDSSWVPSAGTVLDGRYRLIEPIDRGGMGVILRARHLALDRDVAVKVLRREKVGDATTFARFKREVAVAAQLEHRNIVQCHDSGETPDGALYMVMELLEGRSLKLALGEEDRFDLPRAAELARQMLDGLATAHSQGFIHRDLKPGNIFLVKDMRGREVAKLLDFGLAKSIWAEDVKITQTGAICGTTSYFAPELLFDDEPTPAIDVYACGLIMLEMVTGRKSFDCAIVAQALLQHMSTPALIPRRIWETPYGQLIADCLRKHPDERPRDAVMLLERLAAIQPHLPPIRLEDHELPPTADGVRDPGLLADVLDGKLASNHVLRRLPAPEPFEPMRAPDGDVGQRSNVTTFDFNTGRAGPLELQNVPRRTAGTSPAPPPPAPEPASTGFSPVALLGLVLVVALAAGGFYVTWNKPEPPPPVEPAVVKLPTSLTAPPPATTVVAAPDAGQAEELPPPPVRKQTAKRKPRPRVESSQPKYVLDKAAQKKLIRQIEGAIQQY